MWSAPHQPFVLPVRFYLMDAVAGGAGLVGLHTGQLFRIVEGARPPGDPTPVDALQHRLLNLLFGEGVRKFLVSPQSGRLYCCATPKQWESALGWAPRAVSPT